MQSETNTGKYYIRTSVFHLFYKKKAFHLRLKFTPLPYTTYPVAELNVGLCAVVIVPCFEVRVLLYILFFVFTP